MISCCAAEAKSLPDAALIASARAVEDDEITRCGTLVAWAKQLGRDDCAGVLQQTLDEEHATDERLIQPSRHSTGGRP